MARETEGDSESLCFGMFLVTTVRASTHEQETLGVMEKSREVYGSRGSILAYTTTRILPYHIPRVISFLSIMALRSHIHPAEGGTHTRRSPFSSTHAQRRNMHSFDLVTGP